MHKDYIIRAILDFKKKYIGEGGYMLLWEENKTKLYVCHYRKEVLDTLANGIEYISYEEMVEKINQLDKFTVIDGYTVDFNRMTITINWH